MAALIALIAVVLVLEHLLPGAGGPLLTGWPQLLASLAAGLGIGVVASLLGVAGGELLIPDPGAAVRRCDGRRKAPMPCSRSDERC